MFLKILENEIWNLGRKLPLATFGSERVKVFLGEGKGHINHLLYMDDLKLYGIKDDHKYYLMQSVRVISTDICMEFGINKCTTLIMKRGKAIQTEGMDSPAKGKIKSLDQDNEGYKFWLQILVYRLGPKTKISSLFHGRTQPPEVWFRLWRRLPVKGTVIVYEDLFLR